MTYSEVAKFNDQPFWQVQASRVTPPTYLSTFLPIYLPTYLPTYLPIYVPTHLSIYPPMVDELPRFFCFFSTDGKTFTE